MCSGYLSHVVQLSGLREVGSQTGMVLVLMVDEGDVSGNLPSLRLKVPCTA